MKRVLVLVILMGMICMATSAYAAAKNNASSVLVDLSSAASKGIVFPYPTRDLYIRNNSKVYVWVDLNNSNNGENLTGVFDYGLCSLIAPGETIEFYDFITEGITVIRDESYIGIGWIGNANNLGASPISVESIY